MRRKKVVQAFNRATQVRLILIDFSFSGEMANACASGTHSLWVQVPPKTLSGCLAQWLEQSAHNRLVAGSSPVAPIFMAGGVGRLPSMIPFRADRRRLSHTIQKSQLMRVSVAIRVTGSSAISRRQILARILLGHAWETSLISVMVSRSVWDREGGGSSPPWVTIFRFPMRGSMYSFG